MSAKVTKVTIMLSEADLMENLREFVQVKGLTFNKLGFINDSIEVTGNFRKIIDLPVYARVRVESVTNNIIRIKLERIKVAMVPTALLWAGLSSKLSKVASLGITREGDTIVVDVDSALQKVPNVHVAIDNISMENGWLAIKVSNLNVDVKAMKAAK